MGEQGSQFQNLNVAADLRRRTCWKGNPPPHVGGYPVQQGFESASGLDDIMK